MKLGIFLFGIEMFIIIISSLWIFLWMSMKCSSFPLLISFGLKTTLSDTKIATPASTPFFLKYHLSSYDGALVVTWVS